MAGRVGCEQLAMQCLSYEGGATDVAGEHRRLAEELAQCKADKEFVWSLWKQLQKDSPDVTTAIDRAVTRERERSEFEQQGLLAALHNKEEDMLYLQASIKDKNEEISQQNDRLLEVGHVREQLEVELERQSSLARQAVIECGELKAQLETSEKQASTDKEALSGEVLRLQQSLQEQQQQLATERMLVQAGERDITALKAELQEVRISRDVWANHTTLQVAALDKLRNENTHLKADVLNKQKELKSVIKQVKHCQEKKSHSTLTKPSPPINTTKNDLRAVGRVPRPTSAGATEQAPSSVAEPSVEGYVSGAGGPSPEQHQQQMLDGLERELFETRAQLEAKAEEVAHMRYAHDRRLQRMQALQNSHRLVLKQLKTYETKSSTTAIERKSNKPPAKTPSCKSLQQEGSEAVWNELAQYKAVAEHAEQQLLTLEEERDLLKARCLRNQSTIAELRACLQHEKTDLERKICAIAEVESSLFSSIQDQKVMDLELHIESLQKEKKGLLDQCRKTEKECYKLRQEVATLQTNLAEREHANEVKMLKMLTKTTMTDDDQRCQGDSVSVTDSAVQVDTLALSNQPVLKDAQLSPHCPWKPQLELSSIHGADTTTDQRPHHRRTYSDGEILVHKVRANNALERMYDLSRNFQSKFQSSTQQKSSTLNEPSSLAVTDLSPDATLVYEAGELTGEEPSGPSLQTRPASEKSVQSTRRLDDDSQQRNLKQVELSVKKSVGSGPTAPHKCVWQQQVKSLQQRLKTLTKQVAVLSGFKHSALADIAKEKASSAQAKAEVKEMNSRMVGLKVTIQNLHEGKLKLSESLKVVQSRCTSPSIVKKETLQKLEAEKKALSEKCHKLNETAKSLQEQLQEKANELAYVIERCATLERDTKQKRQIIDDQRAKLIKLKDKLTNDDQKIHALLTESAGMTEKVKQCKHKVELLQTQLKQQTAENDKLMKMLDKCQRELANTIQQLSQCQENAEKQKQFFARSMQEFQHRTEQIQQEHSEALTHLKSSLEEKNEVIEEFKMFTMTLATEMEQDVAGKDEYHHYTVSSRVKEIAQSTLNLSEFEIDEFFTDLQESSVLNTATFVLQVQSALHCKPPFASELVKKFMDFSRCEHK